VRNFIININGDSSKTFDDVAEALKDAIDGVDRALRAAQEGPLHGRNYQCCLDPSGARQADLAALQRARVGLLALRDFHAGMVTAIHRQKELF